MARLRGKVPKRRHRAIKDELRTRGWSFYLDKGMPWLRDFIRLADADVTTAEEAAGADAPDYDHLNWARKEGRVFVTRDEERADAERNNLIGSPGILVLRAHAGDPMDLMGLFAGALIALGSVDNTKERVVVASKGQLKIWETNGNVFVIPAE